MGMLPQQETPAGRYLNPADIGIPPGFRLDVFAVGLDTPINLTFDETGRMLVGDAGVITGEGRVLRLAADGFEVIAGGFNPPLTGITCRRGLIYVAHRGLITVIKPDGSKEDVLAGLPSFGDHHNNRVVFGADGKMYFGQGTATNSGVVGLDNESWIGKHPFFHDRPGEDIELNGDNFATGNPGTAAPGDVAVTGAYSPFAVPNRPGERVKGVTRASGSVMRANPDGSGLELLAWGLRNPFRMQFDARGRLWLTNHGMDVRGSRPVDNAPDEFHCLAPGAWYGWPDFTGGEPVTLPAHRPENGPAPRFLLARHPMRPPLPFALFRPHAAIMGFDFNRNPGFGPLGGVFIAEFGSEAPETTGGKPLPGVGHRVSRIDMRSGEVIPFAVNRSGLPASMTGGGGFERPIDVVFGAGGEMYIADFGQVGEESDAYLPGTGVIWVVART